MIIGLTGRIGTGKSMAATIACAHFPLTLIDLDTIGHDLLKNPFIGFW